MSGHGVPPGAGTSNDVGVPRWLQRWRQWADAADPAHVRASQQGRALLRNAAFLALRVEAGRVTAQFAERGGVTVATEIRWPMAPDDAWRRATHDLAAQVRRFAALLDRRLDDVAAQVLNDAGVELDPPTLEEFALACTCGAAQPCLHAFAVMQGFVARLAHDPDGLLRIRGRSLDELLAVVRRRRGSRPPAAPVGGDGRLAEVVVRPRAPQRPTALLEQMGEPAEVALIDALGPAVERAAQMAWRLAAGDGHQAADEALVLSGLRAQRAATVASLAQSLGLDEPEVDAVLAALFARGAVLRTGSGAATRYRAVDPSD